MNVADGQCEDSLNIINSSGRVKSIEIVDGYSDSVDIDFSSILIDYLDINNAGNDCFDVSGGAYKIKKAYLKNCGDKGLSVGEGSTLYLNEGFVSNANIGLSSKDLSISKVNKFSILDVSTCLEAFQKKQEFGGGSILIDQLNGCSGGFLNDKKSIIEVKKGYEL